MQNSMELLCENNSKKMHKTQLPQIGRIILSIWMNAILRLWMDIFDEPIEWKCSAHSNINDDDDK